MRGGYAGVRGLSSLPTWTHLCYVGFVCGLVSWPSGWRCGPRRLHVAIGCAADDDRDTAGGRGRAQSVRRPAQAQRTARGYGRRHPVRRHGSSREARLGGRRPTRREANKATTGRSAPRGAFCRLSPRGPSSRYPFPRCKSGRWSQTGEQTRSDPVRARTRQTKLDRNLPGHSPLYSRRNAPRHPTC
jgi:hypothetical protein